MSALVFDYGKRHIGVAAANIGSRVVTPLTTVSVNNQKQCRGALAQIIDQWHPEMLVVGLPLNMDDSGSAMSDAAREFGQKLASWFNLPVQLSDERLSTYEASSRTGQTRPDHAVAACVIAETWLSLHPDKTHESSAGCLMKKRINRVRSNIALAASAAHRNPEEITLIAVTKTRLSVEVQQAADLGLTRFGENFVQGAREKINSVRGPEVEWHFIGAIQSNKTREIATNFDWVQSVDRQRIADRLDVARAMSQPNSKLNICIQVNIDEEPQKAGVPINQVGKLVAHVMTLSNLRLRGLMAIPKPGKETSDTRDSFARLKACFDEVASIARPRWDTLSMGMSSDFEGAIVEGSTMIRIGTALFGLRA